MTRFSPGSNLPRFSRRALLGAAAALPMGIHATNARAAEDIDPVVEAILANLTLDQKIAQMFIFAAWGTEMYPEFQSALESVQPGGIILMGDNILSLDQVALFTAQIHASMPGLPPLISVDEEGGPVYRLPNDPVGGAVALGQLPDEDVEALASQRATFIEQVGFDVNFAPVADIAYQPNSFMVWRSFGSDPGTVAAKVSAFIRGSRSVGVMSSAKHFPGHGRTSIDSHFGVPVVDVSFDDWLATDAVPFQAAIDQGVEMVMIGHLVFPQWDDVPMSMSKASVRALRKSLDFSGVILTDDLSMGAVAGFAPFEVLDRAVDAGIDALLYTWPPASWPDMVAHLRERVSKGEMSERRIDSSVRRIIRLKCARFGLTA